MQELANGHWTQQLLKYVYRSLPAQCARRHFGPWPMVMLAGANPAVSLPDLPRTRKILERPEWFVVMQDASLTETARQADTVLPAALTILFANYGSFSCNFPRDFFTLASLY